MDINIIAIFRQKIGDTYHFDLLAVNNNLQSFIVGYVVANKKIGEANYMTTSYLDDVRFDIHVMLKNIEEAIVGLEKIFPDQ